MIHLEDEKMRVKKLLQWLGKKKASGVIITGRKNIQYFSGFRGSNGMLFVGSDGTKGLITDFRYISQAEIQSPEWPIVQASGSLFDAVGDILKKEKGLWLFEDQQMTVYDYHLLPTDIGIELKPCNLDFFRQIKSKEEIEKIKIAADIADRAFELLTSYVRPGKTEKELQIYLDYKMLELGAEKQSFPTIVGSGPNGALPHAVPGDRKVRQGDFVVIDFGAVYQGYCSDETRTIAIGKADQKQKEIYGIVLEAQLAALSAVRVGVENREVDSVARDIITKAGYGSQFGHGLGHSLGLEVHENPRFSPSEEPVLMEENMIMTIEPGIYLPEWGGVRIEDLVVVRPDGCEIISKTTKDLIEIL